MNDPENKYLIFIAKIGLNLYLRIFIKRITPTHELINSEEPINEQNDQYDHAQIE